MVEGAIQMDRRTFVSTVGGALFARAFPASAQTATRVLRIGVLSPGAPATSSQLDAAFAQGLRAHGYIEGQNIVVARRFAEGRPERMSEIADELVRPKIDVIVTVTPKGEPT